MVKLITSYGPQINRIARELGVHKETVRYWYMKRLLKKGYTVQAVPNHAALGLRRVVALVEFSESFKPYADAILMAMSELSYLSSFAKTLPEDRYSIQASVPKEYSTGWIEFMYALRQRGLFSSVRAVPFEWVRVVPMRSEMYDFENDSWQYDWKAKPKVEPSSYNFNPSARSKFDSIDLGIIKQFQLDPGVSLVAISEKLQTNYKTLSWHYRTHLVQNGLLKEFIINWAGTRYDPKLEKALHRRHKYMWLELLVSGVTESEEMELMANTSRLPFVWLEAGGQNYFAQIAFPIETMTEALEFVKEIISPVRYKAIVQFMDQKNALRFTLVPELYDATVKRWKFNQSELLTKFDRLVLEIKGMTS
jgi:DNA-binding Lrp family transcriptional regulator